MKNFWKQSVAAAAIAAFGGSAMAGTLAADGRIDNTSGNEYSHSWTVQLTYDSDQNASTKNALISGHDATLYMGQDGSGNLYVAFALARTYVDNTYGANAVGWSKGHSYDDLRGSDQWGGVALKKNGTAFFAGDMDYIEDKDGNPVYSGGFTGGEGGVTTGSSANVTAASSSLAWNYGEFVTSKSVLNNSQFITDSPDVNPNTSYNVVNANLAGWVFDVVYEFKYSASSLQAQFGTTSVLGSNNSLLNGFGLSFSSVHASPNKLGSHKEYYYTFDTPSGNVTPVVPLPASVWMGGLTLAGAIGFLRHKRRKAAELS